MPNGTYKVSDTIVYSGPVKMSGPGATGEECTRVRICGQSQAGTVIRLVDHAPGFEAGENKPVVSFGKAKFSNAVASNFCQHLTIDTGKNNAGAVGLLFAGANNAAVRNLSIRSGDQSGAIGLWFPIGDAHGLVKNVSINGFDKGVQIVHRMDENVAFEHLILRNQNVAGLVEENGPVSVCDLHSVNRVPAVQVTGKEGQVVLINSLLEGGDPQNAAIEQTAGSLFVRNTEVRGYGNSFRADKRPGTGQKRPSDAAFPVKVNSASFAAHGNFFAPAASEGRFCPVPGRLSARRESIAEWSSDAPQTLFPHTPTRSLNLPVEETPDVPDEDPAKWANVADFGAKGDGKTDDTNALRAALQSGKTTVYFPRGQFVINAPIVVPTRVRRINFLFAGLVAGPNLKTMAGKGAFVITGDRTAPPLVIENLFSFFGFDGSHALIDHAGTRTLVLKDLHQQRGMLYFNSVSGGKVFIENCSVRLRKKGRSEMPMSNCVFTKQTVWARWLNVEYASPEVVNDGGTLWVLGFKDEPDTTVWETRNGGKTEILGGCLSNHGGGIPLDLPAVVNDNSSVCFIGHSSGRTEPEHYWNTIVQETQSGVGKALTIASLPKRGDNHHVFVFDVGQPVPKTKTAARQ